MQKLEEEIFNFDPKQLQRKIGNRSTVRIRSSREKELEEKPLYSLTQSYKDLVSSLKGKAKQIKKPKTFSALTREMILKKRGEFSTQDEKKKVSSLGHLMAFN